MENSEVNTARKKRRHPASDPNGFIVLTKFKWGGFHVTWCKSDSGAQKSQQNGSECSSEESWIIPVSDLLSWRKSGVDELEAMFKL